MHWPHHQSPWAVSLWTSEFTQESSQRLDCIPRTVINPLIEIYTAYNVLYIYIYILYISIYNHEMTYHDCIRIPITERITHVLSLALTWYPTEYRLARAMNWLCWPQRWGTRQLLVYHHVPYISISIFYILYYIYLFIYILYIYISISIFYIYIWYPPEDLHFKQI